AALSADVIVNRGDDAVGLDLERVWSDVAAFDRAIDSGQLLEALELYRGPLLDGFFISCAPEFERWLEAERGRLQEGASRAARAIAERFEARGNLTTAAHWARRARALAIKVLQPEVAATVGPARFIREIGFAGRLRHPRIVPFLDSGEADGLLYFVMPYVEGDSLRDRLKRESQLPLPEALRITGDV